MSNSIEEFKTKFETTKLTVKKYQYWTWSIRPLQATLGSSIIFLNRFCASFGSISTDESSELGSVCADIERSIAVNFQAQKLNYIMLMMVDAHLHFHVIPRYSEKKIYLKKEWTDAGWPTQPELGQRSSNYDECDLQIIRENMSRL